MNINKCNLCKHKSEVGIYNLQMCITCPDNPFVIDERFDAKEVEIKPEGIEEFWQSWRSKSFYVTDIDSINNLHFRRHNGNAYYFDELDQSPVHGKGWTRIFPKVEDESVKRIEIEGVEWSNHMEESGGVNYTGITWIRDKSYDELRKLELPSRGPMKMILEIPKETP